MADNVTVTPGSGANIRTDDVGGVQYQFVKLDAGGDGVSVPITGGQKDDSNSVPVIVSSSQLPLATALADTVANPTVSKIGAFNLWWNVSSTAWDRAPGTVADGALVNLGANNDVWVSSGTVTANAGTGNFTVIQPNPSSLQAHVYVMSGNITINSGLGVVASVLSGANVTINSGLGVVAEVRSGHFIGGGVIQIGSGSINVLSGSNVTINSGLGVVASVLSGAVLGGGLVGVSSGEIHVMSGNITVNSGTFIGGGVIQVGSGNITVNSQDNSIGRVRLWDGADLLSVVSLANNNPAAVVLVDHTGAQVTSLNVVINSGVGVVASVLSGANVTINSGLGVVADIRSGHFVGGGVIQIGSGSVVGSMFATVGSGAILGGGNVSVSSGNVYVMSGTVVLNSQDNMIGRVRIWDGADLTDVMSLANNKALVTAIVDGSGNQITSFGGGTQYQEVTVVVSATGTLAMWKDHSNQVIAVRSGNPLPVAIMTGGGGGNAAILDGVDSSIKATVASYTNAKPLTVRLTDTNGDYIAAGAGTQYTEGTTVNTAIGTAFMFKHTANEISAVSSARPLPVSVNSGLGVVSSVLSGAILGGGLVSISSGNVYVMSGTVVVNSQDNSIGRVRLWDGADIADVLSLANNKPLMVGIVDGTGTHLTAPGNGAILDGADSSIKATVSSYANANPLAVRLSDTTGAFLSTFAVSSGEIHVMSGNVSVLSGTFIGGGVIQIGSGSVVGSVAATVQNTIFGIVTGSVSITGSAGVVAVGSVAATIQNTLNAIVTGSAFVSGMAAHDAAIAGNPVPVGWRAADVGNGAVTSGDITYGWGFLNGAQAVTPVPQATGAGVALAKTIAQSGANSTTVKSAPGTIHDIEAFVHTGHSGTNIFVKLYNTSSNPAVGTNTPFRVLMVPSANGPAGFVLSDLKWECSTGISFAFSTDVGDTGTTGVSSGQVVLNLGYK